MNLCLIDDKADFLSQIDGKPDAFTICRNDSSIQIHHAKKRSGRSWFVFACASCLAFGFAYVFFRDMPGIATPIVTTAIVVAVAAIPTILSCFRQKTFHFDDNSLRIENRMAFVSWNTVLPRETISELRQIKHGGEHDDGPPRWGLQIKSSAKSQGVIEKLTDLNHFGRNMRFRWLLRSLPYEQSYWLGRVVSRWAIVHAEFCPDPFECNAESTRVPA